MAIGRMVRSLSCALAILAFAAIPRAEAQNWDGSGLVRFGVFLQGQFVDYDIAQTTVVPFRQTADPFGFGVGIAAGYDLRLGSFVIGAEMDASFDDGRAKPSPVNTNNEQYGVDYFATLRGRLGFILHPSLMVYGTVGYGLLGAEYKANALVAGGGGGNKKYGTLDGLVYGGGLEWDMGWGTSFIEYLHTDMSGWSFRALGSGNRIALDGTSDVVRLGLKFKVGHDYSHDVYRVPSSGSLK